MAPGGEMFRYSQHFGENVLPRGSHEWLPYSVDEVRLKSSNTNLSFVLAGIILCLGGPEGVVFSVRVCQQRLVGALLNNLALVEHRDFVAENAA